MLFTHQKNDTMANHYYYNDFLDFIGCRIFKKLLEVHSES